MNARERKSLKRALESQAKWKAKAMERKKDIRLLQLRIRDLEASRARWKEKLYKEREKSKPVVSEEKEKKSDRLKKAAQKKIDRGFYIVGQ